MCIRLKSCRGRGGIVERVTYDDVTVSNVGKAIHADLLYEWHAKTNASATPVIRELLVQNVRGTAKRAGQLRGLPEAPIEVSLRNIDLNLQKKGGVECFDTKVWAEGLSAPLRQQKGCELLDRKPDSMPLTDRRTRTDDDTRKKSHEINASLKSAYCVNKEERTGEGVSLVFRYSVFRPSSSAKI